MRGLRPSTDDKEKEAVSTWFKSQPADFYATKIQKLVPGWDKCVELRDYI